MPFTLAHPAAALPLARPLGRLAVPSALVVGSMVPDLGYFLRLGVPRETTHSLLGLFVFCLPLGVAGWALFHALLKHPLASLLPRNLHAIVSPRLGAARSLPGVAPEALIVSLLAGALTHDAWDAVTHSGDSFEMQTWMQGGSTLLGFALLAFWTLRWVRSAPSAPLPAAARPMAPRQRAAVVAALLALSAASAFAAGVGAPSEPSYLWTAARVAGRAAVGGTAALAGGLLIFCVLWNLLFPARSARS